MGCLICCKKAEEKPFETKPLEVKSLETKIILINHLKEIPEEMSAGCIYSKNQMERDNAQYIFAESWTDSIAIMNLNDKIETFKLVKATTNDMAKRVSIFKNDHFLVKISADSIGGLDYNTIVNGTIEIEAADGIKSNTGFYGECGC